MLGKCEYKPSCEVDSGEWSCEGLRVTLHCFDLEAKIVTCVPSLKVYSFTYIVKPVDIIGEEVDDLARGGLPHG